MLQKRLFVQVILLLLRIQCSHENKKNRNSFFTHSPFSPTTFFEIGVYLCITEWYYQKFPTDMRNGKQEFSKLYITEKRLRTEIKSTKTILKLCVSAGIHATLLALLFTNNVLLKLQKYSTHFSSELVLNNHIDKICEVVYFKV